MAATDNHERSKKAEALKALEDFVVNNDHLLALESLIGKFNIFDALGIARVEIRHSNFLAFILDPAESHGQGQMFLKALLMDMLKGATMELRPLSPIDLDGTDLRGVEVRREWKNIDLLITCKDPAFVVVIENKVDSQEHSNQLHRYHEITSTHFAGAKVLYVYLTPEGDDASRNNWIAYSYKDIHRVFERVRKANAASIGDDVLAFLDHYIGLIGTRFMDDPQIDELCRRIYKNHRQALDLIYERVGGPSSGILSEVDQVLQADSRWQIYYEKGKFIDFAPRSWSEWVPRFGIDEKDHPEAWIVLRLHSFERKGKLDFYTEVRRVSDANLATRKSVVDLLVKEAPKFGFKRAQAREVTDKYSRFTGRETVYEWDEDGEPDNGALSEKVKEKLNEIYPALEKLALVLKPILK